MDEETGKEAGKWFRQTAGKELRTTELSIREYKGVQCGTREGKETERRQGVENEGGSRVSFPSVTGLLFPIPPHDLPHLTPGSHFPFPTSHPVNNIVQKSLSQGILASGSLGFKAVE